MERIVDGKKLEVLLVDDGTLDTVVSINGREYRFNPDELELDEDRIEWTIEEAIDAYLTDEECEQCRYCGHENCAKKHECMGN